MKKILYLALLLFTFQNIQLSAQCGCTNCPQFLPDNGTADFFVNVNGADNNDLATNPITSINLVFDHEYLADLLITVTSPGGQTITLVADNPGTSGGPTDGDTYNITFVPSTDPATGWNGSNTTFSSFNITDVSTAGADAVSGTFYPNTGNVEDLNTGTVDGTWTFTVVDEASLDEGNFTDFSINFADETSSTTGTGTIDCDSAAPDPCDADPGTFTTNNNLLCNQADDTGDVMLQMLTDNNFEMAPEDPCGLLDPASTPSVVYILYDDVPTVEDWNNDPAFITLVSADAANNGEIIQGLGYDNGSLTFGDATTYNTTYYVGIGYVFETDPITGEFTTAIDYDCGPVESLCGPRASLSSYSAFTFMEPIIVSNTTITCDNSTNNNQTATITMDIAGGYPAYVAASGLDPLANDMFTLTNNGTGTLDVTTTGNATTVTLTGVTGAYDVVFTDANGCSQNYAGVWIPPTISLTAASTSTCENQEDCSTANIIDLTGAITPPLGTFSFNWTPDSYPSETSWEITNSEGVVAASGGVFNGATPELDPEETYEITFFDSYGDGWGCGDSPSLTIIDDGAGIVVYTYGTGDWEPGCGSSGSNVFGPFLLGSPTEYIDPIGILSGTGVTDNGDNTGTFDAQAAGAGVHTISLDYTNSAGCVMQATIDITVNATPTTPTPVVANLAICTGDDTVLEVTGGTNYEWYADDGTGSPDIAGGILATTATYDPGEPASFDFMAPVETITYHVRTVSDDGCYGCFTTVSLSERTDCCGITTDNIAITNETCADANDGTVAFTVTSNETVEYSVDGGAFQAANNFADLADGTHTYIARNIGTTGECQVEGTFEVLAGILVTIDGIVPTNEVCLGGNDGSLTINATTTSTNGLSYAINGGAFQASNVFTGLAPGTYDITVQDNGTDACSATTQATIASGIEVTISNVDIQDVVCIGSGSGIITINATSTSGNALQYSIDGGASFFASNVFENQTAGTYDIVVQDMTCTATTTVTINPGLPCNFEIADPCNCLDNATPIDQDNGTGGDDGHFSEIVSVTGPNGDPLPAGYTFTVTTGTTGAYDAYNVPAYGTQGPNVPIATDGSVTLTYNATNGYYEISFTHIDAIGYTISLEGPLAFGSASNVTFNITNTCAYPNPVIDEPALALYCPNEAPFDLLGSADQAPENVTFEINGTPATQFDPVALGTGIHTVTMYYDALDDGNGGISPDGVTPAQPGCTQTVTKQVEVNDNEPPVVVCQDFSVSLDANGEVTFTAEDVLQSYVAIMGGNSGIGGLTSADVIVTADGALTISWSYSSNDIPGYDSFGYILNGAYIQLTDGSLTEGSFTFNVSVGDQIGLYVETDDGLFGEGNAFIQADNFELTSSLASANWNVYDDAGGSVMFNPNDNCGIATYSIDVNSFTCDNIGENPVVLTVSDPNGNTANCTSIITVVDNTPPTITCRQPISTENDQGLCGAHITAFAEPFAADNCGDSNGAGIVFTNDAPADGFYTVGEHDLVWTATDESGNTTTCIQEVIVYDTEAPVFSSCNQAITWTNEESCIAQVHINAFVTDNCGVVQSSGIQIYYLPVGLHPIVLTATDAAGNTSEHPYTIFVHDDVVPTVDYCPEDITVADGENVNLPTPSFSDNCSIFSVENDAPETFEMGATAVTWTAMDDYGLTSTCTYNVNVVETLVTIENLRPLEASIENPEDLAHVTWNEPMPASLCAACQETQFDNYQYLGEYYGNQYFLYTGENVTWNTARQLAEDNLNGQLLNVKNLGENNFLKHALPQGADNLWVGLREQNINGVAQYVWENEQVVEFNNFGDAIEITDGDMGTLLTASGIWKAAWTQELHGFIVERNCVAMEQTTPVLIQLDNDVQTEYLLESGDENWPIGTYLVSYEAKDRCDYTLNGSFPVLVTTNVVNYCETGGKDATLWVSQVNISDNRHESADTKNYADYTDQVFEANNQEELISLEVVLGGNDENQEIYVRVWVDMNEDGDFFDANEVVWQGITETNVAHAAFPANAFDEDGKRMRIAVSRYDYAEVCADFFSGETEDYYVSYLLDDNQFEMEGFIQSDNNSGEFDINVTPNPSSGLITIEYPTFNVPTAFVFYDAQGKLVSKDKVEAGSNSYRKNLGSWAEGIYILKVQNGDNVVYKKLIINR